MSNLLNNELDKMKHLIGFGRNITEHAPIKGGILKEHKIAGNGKAYGIVKENAYFYIKTATPKLGKQLVAEDFEYINGYSKNNRYKYNNLNEAYKNLELKVKAVNESVGLFQTKSLLKESCSAEWCDERNKSMRKEIDSFQRIVIDGLSKQKEEYGDHPSFQKQTIEFDDDTKSEKPYGSEIGDSFPFEEDELVDVLTESIYQEIKKKL